jgi:hypothetical protein
VAAVKMNMFFSRSCTNSSRPRCMQTDDVVKI